MVLSSRSTAFSRAACVALALVLAAGLVGCQSSDDQASNQAGGSAEPPSAETATDAPPETLRTSVVEAVKGIDQMRSQLATTFDPGNVTKETFKRVCKPVGMRAKAVARDSGWVVQQLAKKYRNPAHQLDSIAAVAYARFAENPSHRSHWRRTTMNGTAGWRYFQRITVESSCLACHGPKEERPDFVKNGYPDDTAYGFDPGDLRGLYAVFVPDPTPDSALVSATRPESPTAQPETPAARPGRSR